MNKTEFVKMYSKKTVYKKDDFSVFTFWKIVHHRDDTATVHFMDGHNDVRSAHLQGAYIDDELSLLKIGDKFRAKFDDFGGMTHATKIE